MKYIVQNVLTQVQGDAVDLAQIRKYFKYLTPNFYKTPKGKQRKFLENNWRRLLDRYGPDATQVQQAHRELSRSWDGMLNVMNTRDQIPTGLVPGIVKKFPGEIIDDRNLDYLDQVHQVDREFLGVTLRDYQFRDLNTIVDFDPLEIPFHRGIINLATNYGKSFLMAGLIQYFNNDTLVLIHDKEVFRQLIQDFDSIFRNEVGGIGDGRQNPKFITVAMYKTLQNRLDDIRIQRWLSGVRVLLVDESHRSGSKGFQKLLKDLDIPVRYFLSGTALKRTSVENIFMIGQSGPQIVQARNSDLIDQGVSSKPVVQMIDSGECDSYHQDFISEYNSQVISNDTRTRFITEFCSKPGKVVLIAVRKKRHGMILLNALRERSPEKRIYFLHGTTTWRTELVRQLKEGEIDIVISTILRVGVNIPHFTSLILAQGGKSDIECLQLIGRVLRKGSSDQVDVVDFYDRGRWVEKHSRSRLKMFQDEKFEINLVKF